MQENLLIPSESLAGRESLPRDSCLLDVGEVYRAAVLEQGGGRYHANALCLPGRLSLAKKPVSSQQKTFHALEI